MSIEMELRDIEDDYAAGRMGAFGGAGVADNVLKAMQKVQELQQQLYLRTLSHARSSLDDDDAMRSLLRASSNVHRTAASVAPTGGRAPPDHAAASSSGSHGIDANSATPPAGSATGGAGRSASGATPSSSVQSRAAIGVESGGLSTPGPSTSSGGVGPSSSVQTDHIFDEMSRVFRVREASMKVIAENMRQIRGCVLSANEALNSGLT